MRKPRVNADSNSINLSCLPYGVGHDREGVCLLLNLGQHRILLDCGIADLQSLQVADNLPAEFVFCSHAHVDHCRGLPQLNQAFPQLPIYTSEVTAKLLPLYWSEKITKKIENQLHPLTWRSPTKIGQDLELELFPAGHLPGAAAILLTYKTNQKDYKVMYTGDFSLSNFQLVEGLSIENMRGIAPDILIIEGSYGTVRHPHRRQQEKQLMERINLALMSGINVLLPVAPIGLGQEILKLLRSHHQFTGRDLDIWVDKNVAEACNVYLELLTQFPASVQNFAKHQSLFWDDRVCPRMQQISSAKDIMTGKLPCIVLLDRDVDLLSYITSKAGKWLILLPETPHNNLVNGELSQLYSLKKQEWITTETYLLAEHSDGRNTTQLIHNLRPQHVIFVHGLLSYLLELASLEELCNRYQIHSPSNGKLLELPIGDRFIQPKNPTPTHYEGEINETNSYITITLPDHLNNDPRWNKFADTGIIEARWQGDELTLRGIPQRELLQSNSNPSRSLDLDCCQSCCHYRSQRCWNEASPLYGFKVIPEGYCPVFEPKE
jgi:Cft2 family RNA processing exonuclease